MEAAEQEPLMFDDVAIYFTPEEWGSLEEWQKELYKEVMVENYHTLCSLGIPMVKSELLLLIEGGEEPCVQGQPRWEKLGCEPRATPDGRSQSSEDWTNGRMWRDQRPLTYGRRVVRKRCGRRSPNFSRVELERFVSLMDRYLPDELQRTGAISLRQRRSILQDIARRLEPMSGCLRTPRQLLHRWADFNNRDPERLMEIRMQLHFAASGDQNWESDVQTAPSVGERWGRRTSHHPSSSSSSSSLEVEETPGDPLDAVWDEGLSESSAQYSPLLPDPPPHTSLTTHIDAQGRYIVPPPLLDPGLRMIKSEPDSEEDEGGGWSSDVPSPESVISRKRYRRKVSEGESSEWPSPDPASPEDSSLLTEPIDRDSQGGRSIRRSPNFSPAELECFVALMDHFLPDNLIRAGALPIRQRKAILQEIARRLEPLSGCLRTPRQLRHRWTDFNNRDPDRLEEIRSRLRRGNKWRQRRSHRPQQDIKKEAEPLGEHAPEEHRPTTPWYHRGLPKPRNSFSMARLKRNGQLVRHMIRMERFPPRGAEQERPLQRDPPCADS